MTLRTRPRVWPVLLAAGVGLAILLSLGTWQLKRLHWKTELIAATDRSLAQEPAALKATLDRPDAYYVKVQVSGRFETPALRLLSAAAGGAGWEVVQGFTSRDGQSLLVARGLVPDGKDIPLTADMVEITGILRQPGGRATFDVENDVGGNRWYWWDVPAMQAAALAGKVPATPQVLFLLPGSPGTEGLVVTPPKANLRNNHMGYAITWFGLAVALLAVTAVFLRQWASKADA